MSNYVLPYFVYLFEFTLNKETDIKKRSHIVNKLVVALFYYNVYKISPLKILKSKEIKTELKRILISIIQIDYSMLLSMIFCLMEVKVSYYFSKAVVVMYPLLVLLYAVS